MIIDSVSFDHSVKSPLASVAANRCHPVVLITSVT